MIQAIDYANPPAHEYVLRATLPRAHGAGPIEVPGRPTDCKLFLSLPEHDVWEVAALVPGGTTHVDLAPGRYSGPSLVARWIPLLGNPSLIRLRVDGQDFPLTESAHFQGWHRLGKVLATARFHRALGQFGHAEYWITVRGDAPQFDVCLLWHRAIPGPGVSVTSATILTPQGVSWVASVPDPACAPPYLLRPGAYVIPQQRGRPFFFSVGLAREPEHVGTADWSGGGYGIGELPLPRVHVPEIRAKLAADLAAARYELANMLPVESWQPAPTSRLWPASGERSADGHSHDIQPLYGSMHAIGGVVLDLLRIEQLRGQCRASIRLDYDGQPLRLAQQGTWRYYDGFLQQWGAPGGYADAPWEWDSYPDVAPLQFADYGAKSYVQRLRANWALVWLANDPLAGLLAREAATRAKLTWWEFGPPPGLALGTDMSQAHASGALAIAVARALGDAQYDQWGTSYTTHLRQAQMLSGCLVARRGEYPSQHVPFDPDGPGGPLLNPGYALQGDLEFALMQLACYALGASDVTYNAARGMQLLQTDDDDPGAYYHTVTGVGPTTRYIWDNDWPQALHDQMGNEAGDPNNLAYYTAWSMGYVLALAFKTQAPERYELLWRFTGSRDPATARATLIGWGLEAPQDQTNAPFEQWDALIEAVR